MTTATKTLAYISKEIEDYERDKGWLDQDFSFGERMALLHSEASEALEAWRDWGLDDATETQTPGMKFMKILPKPEGVGAEFADIFIRLVGDCRRDGVDLQAEMARFRGRFGVPVSFGIRDKFAEQINTLHHLICLTSMAGQDEFDVFGTLGIAYVKIYRYLTQLCELHGIDLMAEYERKMAFNRTRPYRNGKKVI